MLVGDRNRKRKEEAVNGGDDVQESEPDADTSVDSGREVRPVRKMRATVLVWQGVCWCICRYVKRMVDLAMNVFE